MAIRFRCHCGRQLVAREARAGKKMHCPHCGRALRIPTTQAEAELPRRRGLVEPESLLKAVACLACAASMAAFFLCLVSRGASFFRFLACPASLANAGALAAFVFRKESARWAALAASAALVLCGGAILVAGTGGLSAALGSILAFNAVVLVLLASDAAEAYTSASPGEPEEMPDDI